MSTVTQLASALESIGLRGRDASPDASADWTKELQVKPLSQSAEFTQDKFPRTYLTPALGVQFDKQVKLKEILALPTAEKEKVVHDIAIESESAESAPHSV